MEKNHQLPISVMILLRGYGTANGLSQSRMELAERSHEHTYLGRDC